LRPLCISQGLTGLAEGAFSRGRRSALARLFIAGAHRLLILLTALGQVPLDPRLASFVASGALVLAIGVLMGSAL